ncbi:MAG TPA: acetyl-CoA carboxylase biotin carboxyl carrier protein subunit [Bryobacteraceae bacterium]|nr:acetyl-CoA carboxylase biotin carboxyl carrier protein subunit [Bryobacteraceae bacterium]
MNRIIRIDGHMVEPADSDLAETEPGVYSAIAGLSSWEAQVTANEITIGGYTFLVEFEDRRQWKRSGRAADAKGKASITAAMPGKIVRILVAVDDAVVAGQGIFVVEAMKMQNELKAPRDGRVAAIEVSENDSVVAGAVLAIIE